MADPRRAAPLASRGQWFSSRREVPASAATSRPSHSGSGRASQRSRTWWGSSISTPRAGTGAPGRGGTSRWSGTKRGGSVRAAEVRAASRRFHG
jgi:hypothetical protein